MLTDSSPSSLVRRCVLLTFVHSFQPCPPLDSVSDPPPELQEAIQERIESGRQLDAVVLQLQVGSGWGHVVNGRGRQA